ncbi:MAG: peptide-methionine (S)-S-oxide reductase MsrA [Planctomycetes bacterium]|nr:peptide-methionine (S)-S-oxide reductase MsrA [Planctomycetota bacterium]
MRHDDSDPRAGAPADPQGGAGEAAARQSDDPGATASRSTEVATLGAGCFWCIEAVLEQSDGVIDVRSGYMGGHVDAPSYEQVCTGRTGHAEVVQVTFDPAKLSYAALLDWFWAAHDPTQVDGQGNDIGPQYRSVIFYHTPEQREIAERSKRDEQASGHHRGTIVTEIAPATTFWSAEEYHQDYYRQNRNQPYCRFVIAPKLDKLGLDK